MGAIKDTEKYIYDKNISDNDYLIGTDKDSNKKTKNYLIGDIKGHILEGLQGEVPDLDSPYLGKPDGKGTFTWIKYSQYPTGFDLNGDSAITDNPDENDIYIGLAYLKITNIESTDPLDYQWGLNIGDNYRTDNQGKLFFTWIKYADTTISGMDDEPLGKQYIGLSYDNDAPSPESLIFSDYLWSKITPNSGTDGIPLSGTTLWTWVKYADDGIGTNISDDPTGKTHIGLAYNQLDYIESADPTDYIWGLIDGDNFWIDDGGTFHYTWIKYATTPTTGMSDDPYLKSFIGFSFDNVDSVESLNYEDYQWSNFKGDSSGNQSDIISNEGAALYTWLKFSDWEFGFDSNGIAEIYDTPTAQTEYLGMAVNKNSAESDDPESDNPFSYEWVLLNSDLTFTAPDGKTYHVWDKYSLFPDGKSGGFPSMQDDPIGMVYVGYAYYKATDEAGDPTASSDPDNYRWSLIDSNVEQPLGLSTWLKFATVDSNGQIISSSMDDLPAGKTHIGLAINKQFPEPADSNSNDPTFYVWTPILGDIQYTSPHGVNFYIWDKFSDDPAGAGLVDDPTGKAYIGLAYDRDLKEADDLPDSDDPLNYQWSPIGEVKRTDAIYIWVKFAQSADGIVGFGDSANNATFVGLSHNRPTPLASDNPSDYIWFPIGSDQLFTGSDGKNYYTWMKFAKTPVPTESEIDNYPSDNSYMGLAFRKISAIESNNYRDYVWLKFNNAISLIQATDQNNLVGVIKISVNDLPNGIISETSIADYLNINGIEVSEVENIIFDFTEIESRKVLDFAVALTLSVSNIQQTSAFLEWFNSGDDSIVRYEVFLSSDASAEIFKTTGTTLDLTGLTDNTKYQAFVRGYDGLGNWKKSNDIEFSTLIIYVDDVTPELSAVIVDDNVRLDWSISDIFGAETYELFLDTISIFNGTETTFLAFDLEVDTQYDFYVVASRDDAGTPVDSNPSVVVSVTIPSGIIPLTPPILFFVSKDSESITFNITVPSDELIILTGYVIYYRITGTTIWVETQSDGKATFQTLRGLNSDTSYDIKIQSTSTDSISADSNIITQVTDVIFKAGVVLSLSDLTKEIYEGETNERDSPDTYTQPPKTDQILEGTQIRIYIFFNAKGSIKFSARFDEVYLASTNYNTMEDFFNTEVGSLGAWGDKWTSDYGFSIGGDQFFAQSHRNGTLFRIIKSIVRWTLNSAGIFNIINGEPNGYVQVEFELQVKNKGANVQGKIELYNLQRIISTKAIILIPLDAQGRFTDYFTFQSDFNGSEFIVIATILQGSTGIDPTRGTSQINYIEV